MGYRHFLSSSGRWFLGVRNDFWFNSLDWRDQIGQPNEVNGSTNITVVQPTLEGGLGFSLGEKWGIFPSISFGYEINVVTRGEEVGQGAILLLGVSLQKMAKQSN